MHDVTMDEKAKYLSRPPYSSNIGFIKYLLSYYSFCNDKKRGCTSTNYAGIFLSGIIRACALASAVDGEFFTSNEWTFQPQTPQHHRAEHVRHLTGGKDRTC